MIRRIPRSRRAGRRARDERGAILVELAMVVPILVLLIMGIVDFGLVFNQSIGLRGGVREAAWNGGRGIFGAPVTPSCALTFPATAPDDNTQRLMCMAKRRSGLESADMRVMVRTVDLDDQAATGSYTNGQGFMVCAMRRTRSETHFFAGYFTNTFQRARLTTVVLAIDPTTTKVSGGAETPFPEATGSWKFCDPREPAPG